MKTKKPGPPAERLDLDGDWVEAAEKALKKKRPAEGWPKREPKNPDGSDASGA